MITYHRLASALKTGRSLSRFSCQRLCLSMLIGMALLGAGCIKKQPSPSTAGQPQVSASNRMERKLDIIEAARANIGVPYRFGGTSPATGFDCSGLVCWSYQQVGIQLPRSARDQIMFGTKVERQEDLKPGDIVVFKGTRGRTGWHSGIYTGEGKFVHSPSTGKTVTESRLDEEYYAQRFAGARRIPRDGSATEMYAQYEAQQRASALVAQESQKSRKSTLVATSKKGGKDKTSAKKSDKRATDRAGKKGKAVEVAAGSKSGRTVADAGSGKSGKDQAARSKAGEKQKTEKNSGPSSSGKKTGGTDKQPVAAAGKPKTKDTPAAKSGSVQTAKNGAAKSAPKNKSRS